MGEQLWERQLLSYRERDWKHETYTERIFKSCQHFMRTPKVPFLLLLSESNKPLLSDKNATLLINSLTHLKQPCSKGKQHRSINL